MNAADEPEGRIEAVSGDWFRCPRCDKLIRLKRWLGFLHFCQGGRNG